MMQEETQECFKSEFVAQQLCGMLAVLDPSDEVGRYVIHLLGHVTCSHAPPTQATSCGTDCSFSLDHLVPRSSHYSSGDSTDQDMATGVAQVQFRGALTTVHLSSTLCIDHVTN